MINAFEVPSFTYIKENKKFIRCTNPKKLLASAASRSEYIRSRYNVLLQRVLRHELFSQNTNENIRTTESTAKKYNIKYVENLLSSSKMNDVVILGLLSKFKENKFYLEDPTGALPVDLQVSKYSIIKFKSNFDLSVEIITSSAEVFSSVPLKSRIVLMLFLKINSECPLTI